MMASNPRDERMRGGDPMLSRLTKLLLPLLLAALLSACPPAAETKPDPTQPAPAPAIELTGHWEQDVADGLEQLVRSHGRSSAGYDPTAPPVVVFDFDNTVIRGDIGRAFFDWMALHDRFRFDAAVWQALPDDKREAIREAHQSLQQLPAAERADSAELQRFRKRMHRAYWSLCHDTDPAQCYPWQVRFYAGYTPDAVRAMAAEVFAAELKRPLGSEPIRAGDDDPAPAITSTGIRLHPEILQLMELLKTHGFELWVVTAGPQWVVQGAAAHLPLEAERMIGMRTVLADGELTTEMAEPPTFREGKVAAIEEFIGRKPLLVVGDSWTDAEMMAYGQHAVLIDRGYADLKKKAFDSGWWVQPDFPTK